MVLLMGQEDDDDVTKKRSADITVVNDNAEDAAAPADAAASFTDAEEENVTKKQKMNGDVNPMTDNDHMVKIALKFYRQAIDELFQLEMEIIKSEKDISKLKKIHFSERTGPPSLQGLAARLRRRKKKIPSALEKLENVRGKVEGVGG